MNANQNKQFYLADGHLNLNELFYKYSQPLFYYALKFVDEEVAKDFVQDVFFKLWEDKNLIIKSSLNALLFAMIRNKCLQYLEKQKVRNRYEESVIAQIRQDELLFYSDENPSLIELEMQEQLQKAIDQLPEKCRVVFKLSRFQNKKNKEIAVELGISVKTVEKHITKSLKMIRIELKDYIPLFFLFQEYLLHPKNSDFFIS